MLTQETTSGNPSWFWIMQTEQGDGQTEGRPASVWLTGQLTDAAAFFIAIR